PQCPAHWGCVRYPDRHWPNSRPLGKGWRRPLSDTGVPDRLLHHHRLAACRPALVSPRRSRICGGPRSPETLINRSNRQHHRAPHDRASCVPYLQPVNVLYRNASVWSWHWATGCTRSTARSKSGVDLTCSTSVPRLAAFECSSSAVEVTP